MNQKTWSGTFSARQRDDRGWVIVSAEPERVDVHLIGATMDADIEPGTFDRIEIEWTKDAVDVSLKRGAAAAGGAAVRLRARAAFVHQELPRLYADLPLEVFGPRSQAFWKRIFFIVKIPGGRRLLNYIARRARA